MALIWIYMGLIPKILFTDSGELEMIKGIELFHGIEMLVIHATGIIEILFGVALLLFGKQKWLHLLNIIGLFLLTSIGLIGNPYSAVAPFNPVTITLAMIVLSLIVLNNSTNLPSSKNCIRSAPKK